MPYKIAVGSSDGIYVDLKFGEVSEFLIYEADADHFELVEKRTVPSVNGREPQSESAGQCRTEGCGASGCAGGGHGCGGASEIEEKVNIIADCRCVVCKKIGFQAQKQFERKAISVFDVECEVKEAITKITSYYDKIDRKKSLKNL